MSNRRKLKKLRKKEQATTNYTVQNLIDDEVEKFGLKTEITMQMAKEGGEHGVMIIGTEQVFVSEYVPFGRVLHAKDNAAYLRYVEKQQDQ